MPAPPLGGGAALAPPAGAWSGGGFTKAGGRTPPKPRARSRSAPGASGPLRGAMIGACLYEGWAQDAAEAESLLRSGAVHWEPCHHHGAVGPMAGVTSPSMQVYVVENVTHGNYAYSNLNEGYGKVLR